MSDTCITDLASILHKAQGEINEAGEAIDVGGECVRLRQCHDRTRAELSALREQLEAARERDEAFISHERQLAAVQDEHADSLRKWREALQRAEKAEAERDDLARRLREAEREAGRQDNGEVSWCCYHCGDIFRTDEDAKDHFGRTELDEPACKIAKDLAGLIRLLREQEDELRQFRREDTELSRAFYALGAKHSTELRQAEETGYARGLEDAKKYPEELDLQPSAMQEPQP